MNGPWVTRHQNFLQNPFITFGDIFCSLQEMITHVQRTTIMVALKLCDILMPIRKVAPLTRRGNKKLPLYFDHCDFDRPIRCWHRCVFVMQRYQHNVPLSANNLSPNISEKILFNCKCDNLKPNINSKYYVKLYTSFHW